MGYNYNGRLRSAEVLLRPDGSADLIRRAERPGDYFATLDVLPSGRELLAKSRAESARRRAQDERLAVAATSKKTDPKHGESFRASYNMRISLPPHTVDTGVKRVSSSVWKCKQRQGT